MRLEIAIFAALFVAGCCCKDRSQSTSSGRPSGTSVTRAAPPAPPKPKEPDLTVTAKQLSADYQANEVAADDSYKGKVLRVSGKVKSIDKDFMDSIIVRLDAGDPYGFKSVMAYVGDADKNSAKSLSKGESISVTCDGGGMVMQSPVLRDCKID